MTVYSKASLVYDQALAHLQGKSGIRDRLAMAAQVLRRLTQLELPPSELWREHVELLHDSLRWNELSDENGERIAQQIENLAARLRPPLDSRRVSG